MRQMRSLGIGLVFALVALLLCSANTAWAQDVTATITGTVTDASGGAISGATVSAKDVARGTVSKTTSNEAGLYRLSQLAVGDYELRVEMQGFQTSVIPQFTLVLNQVARIDVAMKVGQVTQTVEVTGAAPIMKTEATLVDTVIDSATNEALPLATRNYVELTLLAPGAVHPDPSSFNNGDNVNSGARPFINGNREQANNFLLDGMDNNEVSDNLLGYTPSPDAIEEFNMITNNAPAEFGNFMGGIVSATLKSGTNNFHGDVWEFFRNDKLNANQWENKINPTNAAIPRAPLRWNMYGGTLGGPVIKNKLFVFMDYQGQKFDHPPAASRISVFNKAEKGGDFGDLCTNGFDASGICLDRASGPNTPGSYTCGVGDNTNGCQIADQLYNPCAAGTGVSGTPCTASAAKNAQRPAFAKNVIPVGMISPVATALFNSNLYPATINDGLVNNAIQLTSQQFNSDQGDIKVDYKATSKDQISGRFTRAFQNDPSSNSQVLLGNSLATAPIWSTVGDWTRSISNNVINDARFGWNHITLNTGTTWDPSVATFGQSIGIPGSNPAGQIGLLSLAFGGGTPTSPTCGTINCIGNSMVTQKFDSKVWQADDSVTWVRGRHTFKFGGEYMFDKITVFYSGNSGSLGGMTFGSNYTASSAVCTDNSSAANCTATSPFAGNGMGDFFLGLPTSFGRGLAGGNWVQTSNIFSFFGQDTWRTSDHLTLTLGLRYEAHTPWIEQNNQQSNFNPETGQVLIAGQNGAGRALYQGYYGGKDFQPRLGFAWTPNRFNGHTVIRGAFTISDYLEGTGTNLRLPLNPPFDGGAAAGGEFQVLYQNQALPNSTTSDGIIAPPPAGTSCPNLACFNGQILRLWDQHVQPAIDDEWNLTVQQQLNPTTTFQLGYVGQWAYHLMVPYFYGQPVAEPASSCSTPPCTSPSPFFSKGQGPLLLSQVSTVSGTQSNGTMKYNALQAVLHKAQGKGLEYQVAYTYAKCMSNNTGYYGTWSGARASATASPYWQNIYNPAVEWAPCYYDEKHNLTSYAVYELPFGKGKQFGNNVSSAVDKAIGGWTVSPILTLHGGFPMALYTGGTDHTGTSSRGLRPDCNGKNTVFGRGKDATSKQGGGFVWFDPSNYSDPTGFGTCAPQLDGLRGPGYYNWDLSLQKNIQMTERFKLQFRGDFLNAFNRVNLAVPNTTVNQSTTGVIQASQPARNIQFALKLYY